MTLTETASENSTTRAAATRATADAGSVAGSTAGTAGERDITDNGTYFTAPGVPGRIFKEVSGHTLTLEEVQTLLAGGEVVITDGKKKDGTPFRSNPTLKWDADAQPYPKINFIWPEDRPAAPRDPNAPVVTVKLPEDLANAGDNKIRDDGSYFTIEAYKNDRGWPVRFWKTISQREITAEELRDILESGEEGFMLDGFTSRAGRSFSARLRYNAKKEPYPGLEFLFDDRRS